MPGVNPIDQQTGLGAGAIDIGAITVDPTDPKTIYVGTGEGDSAGDGRYGTGILKSINGGNTFTLVASQGPDYDFFQNSISKIIVDPTHHNILYASVVGWGRFKGDRANWGIYKNTNGGLGDWVKISDPIARNNLLVTDMDYVVSGGSLTLYAGVWNFARGADQAGGIYKGTIDAAGNVAWAPVTLPDAPQRRTNGRVAFASDHTSKVYAAVCFQGTNKDDPENGHIKHVYEIPLVGAVRDLGDSLIRNTQDGIDVGFAYGVNGSFGPLGRLYVGGVSNAYPPSRQFGVEQFLVEGAGTGTWTFIDSAPIPPKVIPHTDIHAAAVFQNQVYFGTDGGLWRFTPRGDGQAGDVDGDPAGIWEDLNTPPAGSAFGLNTNQVNSVGVRTSSASLVLEASQDNAFGQTSNGGTTWTTINGGDGIAVRPARGNVFYFLEQNGAKFHRWRHPQKALDGRHCLVQTPRRKSCP